MQQTVVLVPTLNEADGIGPTIRDIERELENPEIIVVDSKSRDGTAQIAAKLGAQVITYPERGKGRALAEGLRYLKKGAKWLVVIDGDYTYPASYLPKMIKIMEERPDVGMVSGRPYLPYVEKYNLWIRIKWVYLDVYSLLNYALITLHRIFNGVDMKAPLTGERVIRYECVRDFQPRSIGFDIEVEINSFIRKRCKIIEIPIQVRLRLGKAKFHRFKHFLLIFRRIIIEALS